MGYQNKGNNQGNSDSSNSVNFWYIFSHFPSFLAFAPTLIPRPEHLPSPVPTSRRHVFIIPSRTLNSEINSPSTSEELKTADFENFCRYLQNNSQTFWNCTSTFCRQRLVHIYFFIHRTCFLIEPNLFWFTCSVLVQHIYSALVILPSEDTKNSFNCHADVLINVKEEPVYSSIFQRQKSSSFIPEREMRRIRSSQRQRL